MPDEIPLTNFGQADRLAGVGEGFFFRLEGFCHVAREVLWVLAVNGGNAG